LTKKPLSRQYHEFSDGTRVGRDPYSAFVARFVYNDRLDAGQMRAKSTRLGQVRKRFGESHQTDLICERAALCPSPRHTWRRRGRSRKAGEVYPQASPGFSARRLHICPCVMSISHLDYQGLWSELDPVQRLCERTSSSTRPFPNSQARRRRLVDGCPWPISTNRPNMTLR
jgi:hypothetical protein